MPAQHCCHAEVCCRGRRCRYQQQGSQGQQPTLEPPHSKGGCQAGEEAGGSQGGGEGGCVLPEVAVCDAQASQQLAQGRVQLDTCRGGEEVCCCWSDKRHSEFIAAAWLESMTLPQALL